MAIDPVCGAHVSPKQAQWLTTYGDRTYYFCGPSCRNEFIDDPAVFLVSLGEDPKRGGDEERPSRTTREHPGASA